MDALRKEGESIGARIEVVATNVPPGLGEPIFDRLDADLAHALDEHQCGQGRGNRRRLRLVSTPKAPNSAMKSRQNGFLSNHAGGILGGISSGQPINASIALKPTSSLRLAWTQHQIPTAKPSKSSPKAATTPASASAPHPSSKP